VVSLSKAGYVIITVLWGELIQNVYVMEVSLSGGYGTSVVISVTLDEAKHRAAHILSLTCKKDSRMTLLRAPDWTRAKNDLFFCPGDAGSKFPRNVGTSVTNN